MHIITVCGNGIGSSLMLAGKVQELCDAEGIDLLIWAKNWPGEAPSGLAPAYENNSVAVYLVP